MDNNITLDNTQKDIESQNTKKSTYSNVEIIRKPRQTRAPLVKEGNIIEIPYAKAKELLKANTEKPKRTEKQEEAFRRMREALEKKRAEINKSKEVANLLQEKEEKQEDVKFIVRPKEVQAKKGSRKTTSQSKQLPQLPEIPEVQIPQYPYNHPYPYSHPPPPPPPPQHPYNQHNPYNGLYPFPYPQYMQYHYLSDLGNERNSRKKAPKKQNNTKPKSKKVKESYYSETDDTDYTDDTEISEVETDYETRIKRLDEINKKLNQQPTQPKQKFSVF